MLFHHVGVHVSDFKKSVKLYDALMTALAIESIEIPKFIAEKHGTSTLKFFGETDSSFRVVQPPSGNVVASSSHLCFTAPNEKAVDDFYQAATSLGAEGQYEPIRSEHDTHYHYGTAIKDYDGNYIEVVYVGRG